MSCKISNLPKYQTRKSPSIPANDCDLGTIETGNDGNLWQIVRAGKSQRWVKCGTGKTDCDEYNIPSKNIIKPSKKQDSNEQHFAIKGKVTLSKTAETREKLPDNKTFYQYMTKNKQFVEELVEYMTYYQRLYDKIYNINLDQNLNLSFNITNINDGKHSIRRKDDYGSEFMSENEIKEDIVDTLYSFSDTCYEGSPPSACLYPDSNGDELAEITVENLSVKKVFNPNSKSDKKTKKNTKPIKPIKKQSRKIFDSKTNISIYKSSVKKSKTSKSKTSKSKTSKSITHQ